MRTRVRGGAARGTVATTASAAAWGLALLVGAGVGLFACARGSQAQQDAAAQADAPVQLDAAPRDAADAASDAPVDTAPQQDAPRDSAPDTRADTAPQQDAAVQSCAKDDDCNPDGGPGGRYCYMAKNVCYTPGRCSSDAECPNGSTCKAFALPPGSFCTCKIMSIPPILCRDEGVREDCVPVLGLCDVHTVTDAGTD